MKKTYLLLLSFVIGSGSIIAQNRNVIQLEVVDDNTDKESTTKSDHGSLSIKMNPLIFFRGDIPLYFEKSFSSKFAIEIGAGLTHTDYLAVASDEIEGFSYKDSEIKAELGFSGRVGFRYYASNYGFEPEGIYFAIEYRYQHYNSVLNSVGTIDNLNEKLQRTNSDFRLTLGYVNYFDENVYIEPYAGFGIRARSIDRFITDETTNTINIGSESDIVPFLSLGFKIGISLSK
jgi:hypothetical protein